MGGMEMINNYPMISFSFVSNAEEWHKKRSKNQYLAKVCACATYHSKCSARL